MSESILSRKPDATATATATNLKDLVSRIIAVHVQNKLNQQKLYIKIIENKNHDDEFLPIS